MSLHGSLIVALSVGVLALGLAACGGGGGGGSMSRDTTETDRSADEQRMKITGAIAVAQSAVGALDDSATDASIAAAEAALAAAKEAVMAADALSAGEMGAYDTTISVIEGNFAQARSSIAMARDELRRSTAAEAARLRTALDGARISDVAATVEYGAAPTLAGTIPSDPPVPVTGLRPEAVAGSATRAGGWTGAAYNAADEAAGTADAIVFYTDIDPPGTQPFGGEMGKYGTANGLDTDGNLPIVAATDATLIASTDFPTGPGIRTHMAGMNGVVEVAGTFDGALGNYICVPVANGCTSSIRAGGGVALQGGGGWKFVPAQGAVVAKPDTEYAWFGWWQRTMGESYAVGAFHGGGGGDAAAFADFPRLQGTAIYRGPAVGKFVFDPQIGVAKAGDFTATATLAVDFGDDADPGSVTGTVDGLLANGEAVPWSVALQSAAIAADGAIAAGDTVWSIDGQQRVAAGSPTWSGRLHDVDADKVPRTATGSFSASYGDIGRMTGAFGTDRQP